MGTDAIYRSEETEIFTIRSILRMGSRNLQTQFGQRDWRTEIFVL